MNGKLTCLILLSYLYFNVLKIFLALLHHMRHMRIHVFFSLDLSSVETLNVLVPELLDKLKVVENKRPVNNMTTNIMRIRELIAQARSVAKKVSSSL